MVGERWKVGMAEMEGWGQKERVSGIDCSIKGSNHCPCDLKEAASFHDFVEEVCENEKVTPLDSLIFKWWCF